MSETVTVMLHSLNWCESPGCHNTTHLAAERGDKREREGEREQRKTAKKDIERGRGEAIELQSSTVAKKLRGSKRAPCSRASAASTQRTGLVVLRVVLRTVDHG